MYSPTLLASFVKVDVVCCMLFHESTISAMSSAKSKCNFLLDINRLVSLDVH